MALKKPKLSDYFINDKLDLDRIIDDFTPYIRTIIKNMSGNYFSYEDKEEILSDTFFILWKNRFYNILALDAYLTGIAKNIIREKFKKKNITYNLSDFENTIKYYDEIELFSEKRERLNNLKISYKSLNDLDFKILSMYYYYSKSIKEISVELNITESNVKTRLFRIRKKLRKELKSKEEI